MEPKRDDILSDQDIENLCLAEIESVLAKHGCAMAAAPVLVPTAGEFFGVKVNVAVTKIKARVLTPEVDLRGVLKNLVGGKGR